MLALAPFAVHAEGEDPDAAAAPKPAHHKVVKKKKAAPTQPAGPIPYTTLNPAAARAQMAAPPLPPPVAVAPQPVVVAPPAVAAAPVAPPQPAPHGPVTEINLKCDTVTNDGRRNLTRGSFYIDLFPSQVFPDLQADFKFYQVDPQHASLIRGSYCLDTMCDAKVSGSAYFLVDRRSRKGAALRITLNRATGAFYAEEITPSDLAHSGNHIGESGWCVPQKQADVMF